MVERLSWEALPETTWWAGRVRCRICGDAHVSVMEARVVWEEQARYDGSREMLGMVEVENQECPRCGNMTCDPEGGP